MVSVFGDRQVLSSQPLHDRQAPLARRQGLGHAARHPVQNADVEIARGQHILIIGLRRMIPRQPFQDRAGLLVGGQRLLRVLQVGDRAITSRQVAPEGVIRRVLAHQRFEDRDPLLVRRDRFYPLADGMPDRPISL